MSKSTWTSGSFGMVLGAVAAGVLAVAALYFADRLFKPAPDAVAASMPAAPKPSQSADAPPKDDAAQTGQARAPAPEQTAPVAALVPAPVTAAQDPTPKLAPPSFDLVRIEPDGTAVIAGAAAPQREVEILLDGEVTARADADTSGRFVSFLTLAPSSTARVLSLRILADGETVVSKDEVILAPSATSAPRAVASADPTDPADPAAPEALTASAVSTSEPSVVTSAEQARSTTSAPPSTDAVFDAPQPEPTVPGAQTTAVQSPKAQPSQIAEPAAPARAEAAQSAASAPKTSPAPQAAEAAAPNDDTGQPAVAAPVTTVAPTVLLSNADGIEVLQAPTDPAPRPRAASDLALDAITYSEGGVVVLTGRGAGDENLRVYLDNRAVGTVRIRADGRWRATLPDVQSGTYTLRVDQLTASGSVAARVESPFRRVEPAVLAAATAQARGTSIAALTVQPGNTLWAIARDRYGEGTAYVRVFEANRDAIRDPDLIYPGQVFTLPAD